VRARPGVNGSASFQTKPLHVSSTGRLQAVVFDVGETLLDESRAWSGWARWLGVSELTLAGLLGATIAQGRGHVEALRIVKPGFDFAAERQARAAAGVPDELRPDDLYPDALPCIAALREMGLVVGAAGNTGADVEGFLRTACGLEVVASSAGLGAAKPAPEFFAALARLTAVDPARIAYVGDRVDNDVLPARAAGMLAVHIRRGPWGHLHAAWPEARRADIRIDSLAELPALLA
jgi:FMN hydrolase / 5-amino-6-(5-phospho-D-ribitylamino)uracil phosphatase